ncbi:MAG: phosphate ABC transporter substrate-binding protein PstS [Ruaniaceae bacterium]|nr:phosphate ABC transporter substrate-binding protein PstS [Ruaniaceae bacterium]
MKRSIAGIAAVAALALTLTACGNDAVPSDPTTGGGSTETTGEGADTPDAPELSGTIAGAGASSQEKGQNAWAAEFGIATGVDVSYDPSGSGNGRTAFIDGSVVFAGSDSAMKPEEIEAATARCYGAEPIEVPLWISPIAVVYNIPALNDSHVNMTAETIAQVFRGEITNWNDPAIAASNPDVELPDLQIVPVNRSDKSGTTKNFQEYLIAAAGDAWPFESDEVWPIEGTQSGAQTSGMLEVVSGAEGTIGYVDASRVGELGSVAVGVGSEFVPFSSEAAAKIVDISSPTDDATELRQTISLARDTEESGVYPVVLVSYLIACSAYENEQDAANVQAYLNFIASEEGQNLAAQPEVGGIAPISSALRERVVAALDQIAVAN